VPPDARRAIATHSRLRLTHFAEIRALSDMHGEAISENVDDRPVSSREAETRRLTDALASHEAALLATARFLVREEGDARDLVQQTFETALRHLDELRDQDKLHAWLTTIAVRAALRWRISRARFIPWFTSGRSEPRNIGPDDTAIALRAAVRGLPDRVRVAVVLHHMVGLTVKETAVAMGVTENTVKSELKTGLGRLREELR
jgi:RNA polymerase sigma-70 factor, ECF subfamily